MLGFFFFSRTENYRFCLSVCLLVLLFFTASEVDILCLFLCEMITSYQVLLLLLSHSDLFKMHIWQKKKIKITQLKLQYSTKNVAMFFFFFLK